MLNSHMEKLWIKPNIFTRTLLFTFIIFVVGCTGVFPPNYPDVITLDNPPEVSLNYTYNTVRLVQPVSIAEGNPTAFRFIIRQRSKPDSPLIERVFFPGDSIAIELPFNVFDPQPLGNLIKLIPYGRDLQPVEHLFTVADTGTIVLPEAIIRRVPVVITGILLLRDNNTPIESADVTITDSASVILRTQSDSLGFFRFELWPRYRHRTDLSLVIRDEENYLNKSISIDFKENQTVHFPIFFGASQEFVSQGAVYRILQDFVPFRSGPENGADIQFFLSRGDMLAVKKVAGDRLFGVVEVLNDETKTLQWFEGWVLSQFTELVK